MSFFDYFQIASVAIFLLILVGRAMYMRLSRNINPIVVWNSKNGLLLAFSLTAFTGLAVWIVEVLLYALHAGFHIFPAPLDVRLIDWLPVRIGGVALVTLALFIFSMAFVSFGDSWRVGLDEKTPGALVTTGIFASSRNPIYLAVDLWLWGIFLINGTLIFLIFAVLAVAALHWQIRQEEDFLLKIYGQPYEDYCARTGRYIGW